MNVLRYVSLALLLALGSTAHAENVIVRIENFTFNPPEITIRPGTTVTWENSDNIPHSIIEDQTKFRSAVLDTGETFSMTFVDASDVGYFCGLHPHMKGKVVVSP
jgi:plastocyanin